MKQFVYQTILENRQEEIEKSENPFKVTFTKPIFLNNNPFYQKSNPNESNSPRKRPQTPLVNFKTKTEGDDEEGSEEDFAPRIPQMEMLTKQNFNKPEERKFIRRKSCCCQWCGGISSLETKHQDLVTDIESYGRKRLTQAEEVTTESRSESPSKKFGLSAFKQAVRKQKTLNSFFGAMKKEPQSQVLPDLALKPSKGSFPRNSPALNGVPKHKMLTTRKSLYEVNKIEERMNGKAGGTPSMKDPSLLDLGSGVAEHQHDGLKGKKSEDPSLKLTSLKGLKEDDSPTSYKEKKNSLKRKISTRFSTSELGSAYNLRQTYNLTIVPSTPQIKKIALTSRANGARDSLFYSTQTSFPKKIAEEAEGHNSSYLDSDREVRSALSDRIKFDSVSTRRSKIIEYFGPIQERNDDFGLLKNIDTQNIANQMAVKSKAVKTEPDLGFNSREKNKRIRSIYLDERPSTLLFLNSPSASKRNLVKIKTQMPNTCTNKNATQTLQDLPTRLNLKVSAKPKRRESEMKEIGKEYQNSPLFSEGKKLKSGVKSRQKASQLPTLTTDFSMFNKSVPQIQSATLLGNKVF